MGIAFYPARSSSSISTGNSSSRPRATSFAGAGAGGGGSGASVGIGRSASTRHYPHPLPRHRHLQHQHEQHYYPAGPNRAGVLVIPGGGYSFVSLDYEGADAVRWLHARGLDAWVLEYVTTCAAPAPLYPAPLDEAADAVRTIRARLAAGDARELQREREREQQVAAKREQSGGSGGGDGGGTGTGSSSDNKNDDNDDVASSPAAASGILVEEEEEAATSGTATGTSTPGGAGTKPPPQQPQQPLPPYRLGIWGFSAGAHLAALTLTRPDLEPLLDFAVLAYPVVSMSADDNDGDIVVAHLGSRRNLLGDGSTGHGLSGGGGGNGGVGATATAAAAAAGVTRRWPSSLPTSRAGSPAPVKPIMLARDPGATPTKRRDGQQQQQQQNPGGTEKSKKEKKKGGNNDGNDNNNNNNNNYGDDNEQDKDDDDEDDPFADIPALQRRLSPHRAVGPKTPPTFLFHTANDPAVPVQNALLFAGAMARHARPFQLLVLPDGPHGISLALGDPRLSWTGELERWLRYSIGVIGSGSGGGGVGSVVASSLMG